MRNIALHKRYMITVSQPLFRFFKHVHAIVKTGYLSFREFFPFFLGKHGRPYRNIKYSTGKIIRNIR